MTKQYFSLYRATAVILVILIIIKNVTSQEVDISNKDRCHRLNEMNICNAANQSGCGWCGDEWGCMFMSSYDALSQQSTHYYNCPEPCIQNDTECYSIMDNDSNLLKPFFFYLSTRNNMVCHLQHTSDTGRLYTFHCDESCRKALMNDFNYCQFFDDEGKEFKDYKSTGAIEKKSLSSKKIIIIASAIILGLIILGSIFKVYINHHNKVLEERKRLDLEDSKLENDKHLEAQLEQHRMEINERQRLNTSF